MIHRITLSLLSVSMVTNCIQAAQDEQLPHFQFHKGKSSSKGTEHLRALLWPSWVSQAQCSSDDAKMAAFIQRVQEFSQESHTALKEGAQSGFAVGGVGGAIIGALVAGFTGVPGIHMPERPAENKGFKYYAGCVVKKSLQMLAGAAAGALIGGTAGAAVNAPIRAYTKLDSYVPYCSGRIASYCDDADQHALYQLKTVLGNSPGVIAIIEKILWAKCTSDRITLAKHTWDGFTLSEEEIKALDESIRFSSTALFEEKNMIEPSIETVRITDVLQKLENTDKQHRERIYAIRDGSERACAYVRRNKWRTFMPTGKDISTLTKVFHDVNAEEQRAIDYGCMKHMYANVSTLIQQLDTPDSGQRTELREQIVKQAAEFKQMYRSYNNLPVDE